MNTSLNAFHTEKQGTDVLERQTIVFWTCELELITEQVQHLEVKPNLASKRKVVKFIHCKANLASKRKVVKFIHCKPNLASKRKVVKFIHCKSTQNILLSKWLL
jgi:hypothetical protein